MESKKKNIEIELNPATPGYTFSSDSDSGIYVENASSIGLDIVGSNSSNKTKKRLETEEPENPIEAYDRAMRGI